MKKVILTVVATVLAIHLGSAVVDQILATGQAVGVNPAEVLAGVIAKLWWLVLAPVAAAVVSRVIA